jgi:S1-C subfamily serine protease
MNERDLEQEIEMRFTRSTACPAWHILTVGVLVAVLGLVRSWDGPAEAADAPTYVPAPVSIALTPSQLDSLEEAGEQVASSVVTVDAYREAEFGPGHRRGAGVVLSRSGFIFTPLFVVHGADFVIVSFDGERRSPARVIGRDPVSHLAVLRASFLPENEDYPELAEEQAEVEGAPVGLLCLDDEGRRVVAGTVVGFRPEVGPMKDVLEVAVDGRPGDMGGVLLTEEGQLVGIALATMEPNEAEDLDSPRVFALSASRMRAALERMLREAPSGSDRAPEISVA